MRPTLAAALWLVLAGAAAAQAPGSSLRPIPRAAALSGDPMAPQASTEATGQVEDQTVAAAPTQPTPRPDPAALGLATSIRPEPRPAPPVQSAAFVAPNPDPPLTGPVGTHEITVRGGLFGGGSQIIAVPAFADDSTASVFILASPRPDLRPAGLEARVRALAVRATPARVTEPGSRGQLCGSAGILGDRLETITGRISGCGIAEPVRVREVDGITLSTPATINCDAALALQDWLDEATGIVGRTGGGIASLRVVASYSCRTRNNQPGARLSEHATGNGIDIAGIGLVNGQELTVLGGWRDASQGPILRALHSAACGPFGTVLGPDGDRFHQDHFHFDVAGYRSGPYCR